MEDRPTLAYAGSRDTLEGSQTPMDLSSWLTKNQVAAELGCSTKTVERHAERRAARSPRNALRTRAKSVSGGAV